MKNIKPILYFIMIVCVCGNGCKPARQLENKTVKNLPGDFAAAADTIDPATISRGAYFKDPELVKLIDTALKNNFDLYMAMQKIEVLRSGLRLTKGALLPSVAGVASAAQRKYGLYTMDGAGNISTEITPGQIVPVHLPDYYLGFQAAWEIDIWGRLRNKRKAALARYLGSVEGRNIVITNLIAEVANTYYELLALDNKQSIISETIRLQQNALEIVKLQKETGMANELAVKQFEGQLLNSKALSVEVRQEIIQNEAALNFLLGRFPQAIERSTANFTDTLPAPMQPGIPAQLLRNRPDIREAEYELIASRADVNAAKAAFYPSLNITGGFGYQAFKPSFLFTSPASIAYSIAGTLVAPLINRSAIRSAFNSANASQLAALYNYQKTIVNGYVDVYNQLAAIRNLEEIYLFKTEQADVLKQSVEISSDLFKTGRANYLEVLMIQRNALDAQLQLIDVKKRQYNARINIYKALGGGWR